jgi:iron complex outermembrane recepter protein
VLSPAVLLGALLPMLAGAEAPGGPGAPPPGSAGSAVQAPPDTVPAGDTIAVEGVEVTVLRAPTSLAQSPMAVSVLTEDDLRRARSGAFLEEALQGLPGVQVQNRHNFAVGERLTVRGFGGRAQFGVRGIRVVVDGIPATLPDGQSTLDHLDLGSLGRVEVVRGPASALFGNASGGVVSFHSRDPVAAPVRVEVETAGGSHGLLRTQATGSGTVNGTGYLVSVSGQRWDGYRTNPSEDRERDTYGRADRLGLTARVTRPVAGGRLALTANALDLDSENPGSLAREFLDDPDRPAFGTGPFSNVARRTGKELRQDQAGLRWDGPIGGVEADLSLFGVRRSMVNPIPSDIIVLDRDGGGIRAQVSREEPTGLGLLRWHAGVEAELMFDDRLNFTNQAGEQAGIPAGDPTVDQRERVRAAGLFLQANLPLPGGAEGLLGLRYDRHDFRARDRMERDPGEVPTTGERSMDAVSPSAGMSLPVGDGFHLFGNVGTVFETPSTTELGNRPDGAGGFNPDLEPQRGTAFEAGIRGGPAPGVAVELAAFQTNLRNELVRFQVEGFPGRDFFRNAGSSRHRGVEATLSLGWLDGLVRSDLTYSRTDARFQSFEWDGEVMDGNRIPGLAPHSGRAALRLQPGAWSAELSGSYLHRVPVNDGNTEWAPSHVLVDVRAAGPELPLGGAAVAPWAAVTNVLDRHYIASVVPNAFGARYYEPGPGRSFQVGVRASF